MRNSDLPFKSCIVRVFKFLHLKRTSKSSFQKINYEKTDLKVVLKMFIMCMQIFGLSCLKN